MVTFCDDCMFVQLATCECMVSIQGLVNAIRTYEPGICFIDDVKIIDASGKDCVGCCNTTAITMTMQNGWRIRGFCGYACQTNVTISAGNLAFVCCTPPVVPVANVTYIIGNSTAPALVGTIELDITRVKRYLTNKKQIMCSTLSVFCDAGACCTTQTYTLDNECDPKSQTPV